MSSLGEVISLVVAVLWTFTALAADVASRYASALTVNVVRMMLALPMFILLLVVTTGAPFPQYADFDTWLWLSLAGLVGYVFGDICLFRSYQEMGSRYAQLFMTLAPLFSAIGGWVILGEKLPLSIMLAIFLVLLGIGMSVFARGRVQVEGEVVVEGQGKGEHKGLKLKISTKAAILGIGAAIGQGVGLVISKIGMLAYENALPQDVDPQSVMMPFAATFIRCVAALICFSGILLFKREGYTVMKMIKCGPAISAITVATFFGPIMGVSLSLLAVMYTSTGVAATLMALVPIFILLPSWLFMHQKITVLDIVGTIIAVGGVAVFFL